ncbi:Undecaprenyl-diphosphatase BcrC [Chlamydia trachomatis]|nr:Undecaprenyl-diphosphatase BcrC [Chlamydia trachomatis]
MKNYEEVYHSWADYLTKHPPYQKATIWLNRYITYIMYLIYPLFLLDRAIKGSWEWEYLLLPALGFVFLSLVRKVIKAPRPYEVYAIQPIISKASKGNSMPSRHVFSATIISMCLLTSNLGLGLLGLFLSATLAFCRVLVGVHFPEDVLAALFLGIVIGSLLFVF